MICALRAVLGQRMAGAEVAGIGLRDAEALLEVWTRASGDWTLVQGDPNGTARILAMAEASKAVGAPPA